MIPLDPSISQVLKAYSLLQEAKKPLVIVGKGCCMSEVLMVDNATGLRNFIKSTNLPFLPTPMGKGVISDLDPRNASAARSMVLREADCILLLGARLNWILHFGLPPRFNKDAKIIQVEMDPHEFHANRPSACTIMGDLGIVVGELNVLNSKDGWEFQGKEWWGKINHKRNANAEASKEMAKTPSPILNYYSSLSIVSSPPTPRSKSTCLKTQS